MTLGSGSSTVSIRSGLPSSLPSRMAEWRSLIGNSGLSTVVGTENVGSTRSARWLSGAVGWVGVSDAGAASVEP